MRIAIHGLAAALVLGLAAPALAQPPADAAQPAIVKFPAKGGAVLKVSVDAFKDGADIPFENTQYRTNSFPGLSWSKGPYGTRTYAVIMQDTDLVIRGGPVLHWTMFNIPATTTKLAAGMAPDAKPAGSAYGQNYKGASQPYLGPRTPPGPKHHYHMQVFALDTSLPETAGSSFQAMTEAMNGHVLASGEVVGLGQADPSAPPPPRPAASPASK